MGNQEKTEQEIKAENYFRALSEIRNLTKFDPDYENLKNKINEFHNIYNLDNTSNQ